MPNKAVAISMCAHSLCQMWHLLNLCFVPNNSINSKRSKTYKDHSMNWIASTYILIKATQQIQFSDGAVINEIKTVKKVVVVLSLVCSWKQIILKFKF
jgi:hypothetical protein